MNDHNLESQNRKKKEAIVGEITEKVGKAKAMVFTNYSGLTHQQLEHFKKEIRSADAEFSVAKNTLLKRALGDKIAGEEDKFQQSTGTLFMYGDIVAPLKALAKMMKDFEKPEVKFGLLEDKVITDKEVAKLATLPSRETLIAQILSMMNAPIQGLHRALSWNLQKFIMTLDAVAKKKETMSAAPAPAVEEKVAEEIKPETTQPAAEPTTEAEAPTAEEAPQEEAKGEEQSAQSEETQVEAAEETAPTADEHSTAEDVATEESAPAEAAEPEPTPEQPTEEESSDAKAMDDKQPEEVSTETEEK